MFDLDKIRADRPAAARWSAYLHNAGSALMPKPVYKTHIRHILREADLKQRVPELTETWNKSKRKPDLPDYKEAEILRFFRPTIARASLVRAVLTRVAENAGITWPNSNPSEAPVRRLPSVIVPLPKPFN